MFLLQIAMNVWKFLMFAVMVYVWTCREVTSAYVTMVLRHPQNRLCAWVWREDVFVCGLFGWFF